MSHSYTVMSQLRDDKLNVLFADSFARPLFNDMIFKIRQLALDYHVTKIFIDGSSAGLIKELKHGYGNSEYINYHLLPEEVIRRWETSDPEYNKIVPINFRTRHKEVLQKLTEIVSKRLIRIDNDKFNKLVISLRTAKTKGEMDLDKSQKSFDDLLDALMLSCIAVTIT